MFTCADVEWLNERMHDKIKVNLTEKSWNNVGPLTWTLPIIAHRKNGKVSPEKHWQN